MLLQAELPAPPRKLRVHERHELFLRREPRPPARPRADPRRYPASDDGVSSRAQGRRERLLPLSNLGRIMKRVLPEKARRELAKKLREITGALDEKPSDKRYRSKA